jgi:hypothetical protein
MNKIKKFKILPILVEGGTSYERTSKKGNGKELEILFIQLHLETSHQIILSTPILPFMHLQIQ